MTFWKNENERLRIEEKRMKKERGEEGKSSWWLILEAMKAHERVGIRASIRCL